MYKCKKCGKEFDSKFCPNCGEAATETDAENETEVALRKNGIPNIWMRNSVIDKVIYASALAIGLGILIALIIYGVRLYHTIDDFFDFDSTQALLICKEYTSEVKTICVVGGVLAALNVFMIDFDSCFLACTKIKWVKSQNIRAANIITAGAIPNKGGEIDKEKFLDTKIILYNANRDGAVKQIIIVTIIDMAVNIISEVLAVKLIYDLAVTAFEAYVTKQAWAWTEQKAIFAIGALVLVPIIIMFFVKKLVKRKEFEIDEWAKRQMKEQSKTIETTNS